MSRPVTPKWATNTNHAAGSEDWSGQPNKVAPSSGERQSGFIPLQKVAAELQNYLFANHGDWLKLFQRLLFGGDLSIADDFLGAALADIWTSSGTTSISTDGPAGSLKLDASGASTASAITPTLNIGTGDFCFSARVRCATKSGTFRIGLYSATSSQRILMGWDGSDTHYQTDVGLGDSAVTSTLVGTTDYVQFDIVRIGGTLKYYLDGAEVGSVANVVNMSGFHLEASQSGNGIAYVDCIKFWADRGVDLADA